MIRFFNAAPGQYYTAVISLSLFDEDVGGQ